MRDNQRGRIKGGAQGWNWDEAVDYMSAYNTAGFKSRTLFLFFFFYQYEEDSKQLVTFQAPNMFTLNEETYKIKENTRPLQHSDLQRIPC